VSLGVLLIRWLIGRWPKAVVKRTRIPFPPARRTDRVGRGARTSVLYFPIRILLKSSVSKAIF